MFSQMSKIHYKSMNTRCILIFKYVTLPNLLIIPCTKCKSAAKQSLKVDVLAMKELCSYKNDDDDHLEWYVCRRPQNIYITWFVGFFVMACLLFFFFFILLILCWFCFNTKRRLIKNNCIILLFSTKI